MFLIMSYSSFSQFLLFGETFVLRCYFPLGILVFSLQILGFLMYINLFSFISVLKFTLLPECSFCFDMQNIKIRVQILCLFVCLLFLDFMSRIFCPSQKSDNYERIYIYFKTNSQDLLIFGHFVLSSWNLKSVTFIQLKPVEGLRTAICLSFSNDSQGLMFICP